MAAGHFFVGLAAGVAILTVPAMLFTPASSVPRHLVDWVEGSPAQSLSITPNEDAATNRPLRGYQPGDPTPAAQAAPTIQPPTTPTALPTRAPVANGPLAPNLSMATANLRWAGSGVIRSGGVPVYVRRVAGIDSRDDPQIPDGSPVLVAAGPPTLVAGQQWRGIRALNGIVGWVPSTQLAIDGEVTTIPATQVATATPAQPSNHGVIANTDGSGVVLRNSPNDADRSKVGLQEGTPVTVSEAAGSDWLRVRADNGQTGWVPSRYVKGV